MPVGDEYITRPEHDEFKRRLEDEEARQNRRLEVMENRVDKLIDMQASLAVMQAGIDSISQEVKRIGTEVDAIKQEPADKWRKATWIIVTVVLTAAVTFFLSRMGVKV